MKYSRKLHYRKPQTDAARKVLWKSITATKKKNALGTSIWYVN